MVFGLWICDVLLEDSCWLSSWMFWHMVEVYVGFMHEILSWWVGIYMRCMVWWWRYMICTCLVHCERHLLVILLAVCVVFLTHYLYTCLGILVHVDDGCRLMHIWVILCIWFRELSWWLILVSRYDLVDEVDVTDCCDRLFLKVWWYIWHIIFVYTLGLVLEGWIPHILFGVEICKLGLVCRVGTLLELFLFLVDANKTLRS